MEVATPSSPEAHLARFQLESFRPGQRDVIAAILSGQNCLCIMPTGGGKSLCYQLPSVAREGLTLVVSPLIALMKDQVDSLTELGISATCINSMLSPAEAYQRMDDMAAGRFDLVYIAPERLRSSVFLEKLHTAKVQLLAVDEAHCISEWGHDFRPDYARLGRLRQRLNQPQTIALTATATPDVQADIVAQLQLDQPRVFITGFSRPNLHFEVQQIFSEPDRERTLIDFVRATPGAGIVYSATRKGCEELVPVLSAKAGRRVELYHAGLEPDARRRVQDDFMSGKTPIIVATNAFGMGIDKADLRFVVHYNIPGTLEAYYQEAGRAGRDGDVSRCLLLYAQRDRRIQEYFIDSAYPDPEIVEEVYDFLREIDSDPIELTLDEIRERLNLSIRSEGVSACEKLLESCKALERLDARQNMAAVRIESDLPTLVDLLPRDAKVQRRVMQAIERLVAGRRFERVYLNPRQILQAADVDATALNRAVRELAKLEAFDFVPPFRGRAVHMLERKKPFDELGIDFAEQQRRKDAEYAKLARMVRYATTPRCRQLEILDYFGDPDGRECGTCDNCRHSSHHTPRDVPQRQAPVSPPAKQPPPPLNEKTLDAVRIVLSGVARMKGRYGKQMVARMLVGSQAKELQKYRLNTLSTYGLLSSLSEPQTLALIDALLVVRLLQQVEERPHRPLLRLTDQGEAVMKGTATISEPLPIDRQLQARLQSLQLKAAPKPAAKEQPAAAPKRTLEAPATSFDDNHSSFDDINAALASAGDDFDSVLDEFTNSEPTPRPDHYWTGRLLTGGFSLDECCAIRSRDRAVILQHALAFVRGGGTVDLKKLIAPATLALLVARYEKTRNTLDEFRRLVASDASAEEIELFWLARQG
jgi:ATP-dependent DNA helicase RecQ